MFKKLCFCAIPGAMMVALGSSATGVFTNSKLFWECMHQVEPIVSILLIIPFRTPFPVGTFFHSGYFYSKSTTAQRRSQLQH